MEFRIKRNDFLKGLFPAQGIADRKSAIPIVANVLLRTDGKERILCAATDLTVSVSADLPARVTKEGGLTLGARYLFDIIKALPTEEVLLSRQENNWAVIRSGKAEYKLVGMPDRDYPKLPNHREVAFCEIGAPDLRDRISKTLFSASTDETRYHLNGVLLESDGKRARMVSTDGHRLSKVEWDFPGGPKLDQSVIIARRGLSEIVRVLESDEGACQLAVHQGYLFVRTGALVLSSKLIDAQFPPYDQVIPKQRNKRVVLGRTGFLDALRRISIVANDRTYGIRLRIQGGALILSSDNPDLGQAVEELDAECSGGDVTIGFNARYLMEVLSQIGEDEVVLELGSELDPGVIRPMNPKVEYMGVVMPIRI